MFSLCLAMVWLEDLKGVYEGVFQTQAISTDHWVAKLHYRVTVTILVVFSFLLGLGQVGDSYIISILVF